MESASSPEFTEPDRTVTQTEASAREISGVRCPPLHQTYLDVARRGRASLNPCA